MALRKALIAGAIVIVGGAILLRAYLHRADAAEGRVPTVTSAGAQTTLALSERLPLYLTGIGTVQALQSVTVKVRVDGQLEKVAFREGQTIAEGDLLAQIDAAPYQAALEAAMAQLAKDEASYQNGLVDLKRYENLIKQDSIAQQTYDTQVATVASLKAAVGVDQAQVSTARVNLAYTTIRSPLHGVVGIRLVDAGNIVHATDTTGLVVINQVDPISVIFTLPEEKFPAVTAAIAAAGRSVLAVEARARGDDTLLGKGELLLVNNSIDNTTGTFQLKANFKNPDHHLWPGQFVNIRVITSDAQVVTIPGAAVQRGGDGLYVFVVKPDDTAELRPVTLALQQDGKAVIATGLDAGTRVVVDGQFRLRPGMKVVENNPSEPSHDAAAGDGAAKKGPAS